MSAAPAQDEPVIPREVPRPCSHCGAERPVLNGAYYKHLREDAGVTLTEMSSAIGVTISHLSQIERGNGTFTERYAEGYERVCRRVRRSGQEW